MDCSFERKCVCVCVWGGIIHCKAWHKYEIDSVISFQRLIVITESIDLSIGSFCTISFVKYCRENNKCASNNHLNAAFLRFQYTLSLFFPLSLSLVLIHNVTLLQSFRFLLSNFDFVFATRSQSLIWFIFMPSQNRFIEQSGKKSSGWIKFSGFEQKCLSHNRKLMATAAFDLISIHR